MRNRFELSLAIIISLGLIALVLVALGHDWIVPCISVGAHLVLLVLTSEAVEKIRYIAKCVKHYRTNE